MSSQAATRACHSQPNEHSNKFDLQTFSIFPDKTDYLFSRFGLAIGKHPKLTVALSVALCLVCSVGIVKFNVVTDSYVLWTPYGSPVS